MLALAFATAVVGICALTASSQPPDGKDGPGRKGKKGGPRGFELGRVLPPFVRDDLDLTDEQERAISALEKEVKEKLEKILTAEQRQKAANARPPMGPPTGKGGDGPPAKGAKGGPKGKKDGPPPKDDGEQVRGGGIQWFATWEAGKAEAERTGRPILFLSAAPHCAGVSGIW
jgi:hypothetical protein